MGSWPRRWFEENYQLVNRIENMIFRRASYFMLIDGFAQAAKGYSKQTDNKTCFRQFVLQYSQMKSELLLVCPSTLYYDCSGIYDLPKPDIYDGKIYDYTDPFLNQEAEKLLLSIPEEKRSIARYRHQYISLLYQMRNKLVHELSNSGIGIDFSDTIPQIASGISTYVNEDGTIISTREASLNIPEKYIAMLTWNSIENYFNEYEQKGISPLPENSFQRKSRLGWYD